MRTVLRRSAVTAATLATLAGGAVAMAPTAAAYGSGMCTRNVTNYWSNVEVNGLNLRNGPGTGYYSKGLLYRGNDFRVYCHNGNWAYGQVHSGGNSGTRGWAHLSYLSHPSDDVETCLPENC